MTHPQHYPYLFAAFPPGGASSTNRTNVSSIRKTEVSRPPTVRKRARSANIQDVRHSSSSSNQYPRSSVAGVNAAITAGTLSALPDIISRDINTLPYGAVIRAMEALIKTGHWKAVVDVFDIVNASESMRVRITCRLYTDLFFALMKIGGKGPARKAHHEWLRLVDEGIDGAIMSPRAYNFLFVLLSRMRLVDEALEVRENCVFNGFYLNRYSYNAFLNACAKSNRVEEAFDTLRQMAESNISPDVVSFNVLISCCVRSGDMEIALGILARMTDWGISPDSYSFNSVVNGLRKYNMLEEAFELVALMESDSDGDLRTELVTSIPKARSVESKAAYNEHISSSVDGHSEESSITGKDREKIASMISALATSRRTSSQKKSNDGLIPPNTEDFEGTIPVDLNCSGDAEEEGNYRTDEQSPSASIKPDLVTYNTLISGIADQEVPDFVRAIQVKKHMNSRGIQSNEVTFNSLMGVAARANLVEEAFQVYEQMVALGMMPNCECFTTLITLCGRAKLMERAFQLHNYMIASGTQPNVVTYNALLMACRSSPHKDAGDAALRVLRSMRQSARCRPDVITYSTVIDTLGRNGRFGKVSEVLDEMSKDGIEPNLVTYTSVIAALTRAGDLEGALRVLGDMERHGIMPNVYTFSSLIHGAGRSGEFDKAFDILRMMQSRGITASHITYSTLLQLAIKSRKRSFLDNVVVMLAEDVRLKGTVQMERIVELSKDPGAFSQKNRKKIFEKMSEAVSQCVSLPKVQRSRRQ